MKVLGKILVVLIFIVSFFKVYPNNEKLQFIHYTNENGLPSSYVKDICQDKYGFIWIASRSSVCRFDGKNFKTFYAYNDKGKPYNIWGRRLYECNDSLLIVQTTSDKFYYFDFSLERFKPYDLLNNLGGVTSLQKSKNGFWIIKEGKVFFLDRNNKLSDFNSNVEFAGLAPSTILNVAEKNGKLVALTDRNSILIFGLEQQEREFNLPDNLAGKQITHFYIDNNNFIWIGLSEQGLCRVNLTNGRYKYFSNEQKGNGYLLHNMVHTIDEDKQGRMWIGTEDGLCLWSPYTETFSYYQYDINNPQGLNTNPIYSIFCDKQGNMWLGTYFGGINFWSSTKTFFKTWQSGTSNFHIGGNAVSCITEDNYGNVWIGMEDMGVNKIDSISGEITKIVSAPEKPGLSFNNVHDLLFENDETLWIATYTGGINILNLKTNKFEYINTSNYHELLSDNIYCLLKSNDSIFISTSAGISVYDLNKKKITPFYNKVFRNIQVEYIHDSGDKIWFSSMIGVFYFEKESSNLHKFEYFSDLRHVNFVKTDSKHRVWIGDCLKGLSCYDVRNETTFQYNEESGFPFSWIFSLEEGSDGSIWVSGDKGLVNFVPETNEIMLYNRDSDIPFEQFNYRASFKDSQGNIYFGGNNGMVSFNERDKRYEKQILNIVFRGVQLFNQPLVPGENKAFRQSLNSNPQIQLKYKQNVFTIEYSGLNFQNRGKCQYAYYLEGFEESWNYVGNRDFATYTNLSPGKYVFHVKASVDNTDWSGQPNSLTVIVEPPFWLSNWGFFIYFLITVIILLAFYMVSSRIQKSKAVAEMERREKEYVTDLNNFKLEFFTNVSHELRTPLTLIVGPLTNILAEEKLSPLLRKKMKGIKSNAHRLLTLVNQLLEFRKIELGKEKLKISHQNIQSLLNDIEDSFSDSANSKDIDLVFDSENVDTLIWVDCQKLENIIVNILSNALKFTSEGGQVKVGLNLLSKNEDIQDLEIKVSDTGKGIEPEKLVKIFDRFYNEDSGGGSGIGLAFVKSLVKLHKGQIKVSSEVGKGSVFTVTIPVSKKFYYENEIVFRETQYISTVKSIESFSPDHLSLKDEVVQLNKNPIVLVIDDNQELLDFISESLKEKYEVVTAFDGVEGLEKMEETLPDLIISDVMMPGINGFDLTRKLKQEIKTSHIPVILLTAKSGEENEYEGMKTGADYYVEKPFFPHILNKLIDNILTTRKNLIDRFKTDASMVPTEMAYSESDKLLIEKITKLVKDNIDKTGFDVSYIVKEIGISRSLLHVKLKKLSGCSATEFIRSIRLREAITLISEGKCNISEAAYRTGFSSPAYFTKRFKEHFGKTPKQYFNL